MTSPLPGKFGTALERLMRPVASADLLLSGGNLIFQCRTPPAISLRDYAIRLVKYGSISYEGLIIAVGLIKRLLLSSSPVSFTPLTAHRVAAAASLLATKFWDDNHLTNRNFARVAGITGTELTELEGKLLASLHFDIWVRGDEWREAERDLNR